MQLIDGMALADRLVADVAVGVRDTGKRALSAMWLPQNWAMRGQSPQFRAGSVP